MSPTAMQQLREQLIHMTQTPHDADILVDYANNALPPDASFQQAQAFIQKKFGPANFKN